MNINTNTSQYSVLRTSDDLALGGDVNAQVAVMALSAAKDSREAAEAAQDAEEANLLADQARQIKHMHEQADAVRSAAWTNAAAQAMGGVIQIAGAASGGGGAAYNGAAEFTKATGTALGAHYDHRASEHEIKATSAGHSAARTERRLEKADEGVAEARDFMRAALDFYRQASQAENAADQAAIFQRV